MSLTMLSLEEIENNQKYINQCIESFHNEEIFIYPTDSIYGVGGKVTINTINTINHLKKRSGKHFSIIAPNLDRIVEHCEISNTTLIKTYASLKQTHPGRGYTLLLKFKKTSPFPFGLITSNEKVGVRFLENHPMQKIVKELNEPLITTSCNISGFAYIKNLKDLDTTFLQEHGIMIDDGVISGFPSIIFDFQNQTVIRN